MEHRNSDLAYSGPMFVETEQRLIADLKAKIYPEALRYILSVPLVDKENIIPALWQGIEFSRHPAAGAAILSDRDLGIEEARETIARYVTAEHSQPFMRIND